ncbi:hypothetical protein GJAV_G00007090 [Gymnothorax javanicus]|nr:hypothetical protein GJAV_G00007090 [Gymnothorax javanicus]
MATDIEGSLWASFDLSSEIEAALRVAVCSVLKEIQKLVGKNVAELRAALSVKECENAELRAQLELTRQELRDRTSYQKMSVLNRDPSSSGEEGASVDDAVYQNDAESNTGGDPNGLALEQGSSIWSQPWDSDGDSDEMQPKFMDRSENTESNRDTISDVHDNLDAAGTKPSSICEPSGMISPPALTEANFTSHTTPGKLRDVKVEQGSPIVPVSTAPGLSLFDRTQPYICECGKSYLWLSSLKKHRKTHQPDLINPQPHRCPCCTKTFNYLSSLKKHQLIHTGEKPHLCSLCGKRFRQTQHLKEHYKTHEDRKPFRCNECGWGFNNASNFKRHLLIHRRQSAE